MAGFISKKLNAILENIPKELADIQAEVGWFEGNNYEDGTPVAYVATIHEFGAPSQNIPPRPTMGPTVKANTDEYLKQLGFAAKGVQNGKITGQDAMQLIGEKVAGDIRESISRLESPPLKPATVEQKGFSKPLIDTGQMLNSLTATVSKK